MKTVEVITVRRKGDKKFFKRLKKAERLIYRYRITIAAGAVEVLKDNKIECGIEVPDSKGKKVSYFKIPFER